MKIAFVLPPPLLVFQVGISSLAEAGALEQTLTHVQNRFFNLAIDDDVNDEDLDDEKQDPCGENSAGGENDQLPELE